MKNFNIPDFYKSPIISKVKESRKISDPRKKDFSPTLLDFGAVRFHIARHFGFCYGVENAIEISYKAIEENPDKRLGFANAVAYYMKLAYNNWHKEIVHDDAIQSELSSITDGQLTFTNTPYVKAFRPQHEDRDRGGYGKQRGKFQQRGGGGGRRPDNRGDNRGGSNFKKKRY